ncbi:hypothetical protein EV179_000829 [Coemansia sp. RSA 487]|nr:hypothetical protein EV179_000829 [Coemansia sp. RSA 487]
MFSRAYSNASAPGPNKGNGIIWASLATGAVLVGGRSTTHLSRVISYYIGLSTQQPPPTTAHKLNHSTLKWPQIGYVYSRRTYTPDIGTQAHPAPVSKALDPTKFVEFKLRESVPINHDTSLFRFGLEPAQELGLDITSCLVVKETLGDDAKPTIRPYTPVSSQDTRGHFDLVIKKYETGKMSAHIHSMAPGDVLAMKGPIKKFPYKTNALKEIGMIAGGSGITPMLQLINHVLEDPSDHTKLTLVFANKSENDIILRSTLDELAKQHPNQLKVHYVVDKASSRNWKGDVGYVTKELVQKYMPSPSDKDVLVSVCGPMPMMKSVSGPKAPDYSQGEVSGIFKELGYTSEQVFKF